MKTKIRVFKDGAYIGDVKTLKDMVTIHNSLKALHTITFTIA